MSATETQTTGSNAPQDDASAQSQDTADTQTSEASTQVNETPEATQDNAQAKEAQAPETKATDTVEEKLYAGKYKTVEDMEKAYQELNSKFTNTSQEKAELAKILNDAFLQPEQPAQQQTQSQQEYDYQEEQPQSDPNTERLERDVAVTKFILSHGDADASTMQEVLKSDPYISQINGHEAKLNYAYAISQNMARSTAIAEAEKKGAETTQAKIAEKQAAQVETARQKAQPTGNDDELTQSQLRESLKGDKGFDDLISKKFPGISKMKTRR